ncbi:MAG: hypothetical protein HY747_08795 [Elusimicrobia bacterium]|nr:hypothetical protein [Elusimicrobiota bacterium]
MAMFIVDKLKTIWKKGSAEVSLDHCADKDSIGYLYKSSGYSGKSLNDLKTKAEKERERAQFFLDHFKEICRLFKKRGLNVTDDAGAVRRKIFQTIGRGESP